MHLTKLTGTFFFSLVRKVNYDARLCRKQQKYFYETRWLLNTFVVFE